MLDPKKPPSTIAEMAQRSFVQSAEKPYLGIKGADGNYQYATYGEVALRVRMAAGGLLSLGLARGDRLAILAENGPEWVIADLACQMIGVISVPLFSTLPPAQVQYILEDSGARAVVVSNQKQREKIDAIVTQVPELQAVITMDAAAASTPVDGKAVLHFTELEKRGEIRLAVHPDDYESTWPAAVPDDVATIIYTSGTTGNPKGAMLMHKNIVSDVEAIHRSIRKLSAEDLFLSFLPLAHVYERTAGYYLPTRLGAPIAFCESLFSVDKNMREAKPTVMFCVPRLHETMRDKIYAQAKTMPEGQQKKFLDALELAKKAGAYEGKLPDATPLSLPEKLKHKVYDAMVYSKVREKFGGRLWAFVSGGAPMSPDLGALFLGMGITILEGYGLTETSPVISFNRPERVRLGTVGEILDGVEVKIADDGEILVHGNTVMKGYWNKPDETKDAIDEQGWFHTGDLGAIEDSRLKITGRKKDLLVLANGKKVAPAPIELKLSDSPYIAQTVLLGDKQKAVAALIVPNVERVREWAKTKNLSAESDGALLQLSEVQSLFRQEIDAHSTNLADFEKIRKVALVSRAFSVEEGELTPTLKVKRNVIAAKYGHLVLED